MNIQIFGRSSSFDTKKAQRYFKERRINFQYIDLNSKGMSKGELNSVLAAVGDIDKLLDPNPRQRARLRRFSSISAAVRKSLTNCSTTRR